MSKKTQENILTERDFDIIISPVITEKSMRGQESGKVTFKVCDCATKPEIKKAVETLFKVKVKSVNTVNQDGKKKFRGKTAGVRSDYKKAIVTLEKGQTIDVTTGI